MCVYWGVRPAGDAGPGLAEAGWGVLQPCPFGGLEGQTAGRACLVSSSDSGLRVVSRSRCDIDVTVAWRSSLMYPVQIADSCVVVKVGLQCWWHWWVGWAQRVERPVLLARPKRSALTPVSLGGSLPPWTLPPVDPSWVQSGRLRRGLCLGSLGFCRHS